MNWLKVTSPATPNYNCIAWAANDDKRWWDPDVDGYWPQNVPRENTMNAWIKLFSHLGFVLCNNDQLEKGFYKIAVFENDNVPRHVARQLADGAWTSKLGSATDVQHNLKEDIKNDPALSSYGGISVFMKKPV